MNIFILAAGEQTRWGDFWSPKHLVDIGGEPLIERLVRQVREYSEVEPIIVTHDERFVMEGYNRLIPEDRSTLCATIMSTSSYWRGRTTLLLGDVVFSPEALHTILNCRDPIRVFGRKELQGRIVGRYYELFALSFGPSMQDRVRARLAEAIQHAIIHPDDLCKGRLRRFYERYCALPLGSYQHEDEVFFPIEDWTEDIDAKEDYAQFVAMIINEGLLDASPI